MGLLDRLQEKKVTAVDEPNEVTFVRAKGDFIALSNVKLTGVQVNVGYMTLDGKPEIKKYIKGKVEHSGTPIRLKITAPGKAKGASLVSGRHPMAYYFACVFTELTNDAFEQALNAAFIGMKAQGLNPTFDPSDVE